MGVALYSKLQHCSIFVSARRQVRQRVYLRHVAPASQPPCATLIELMQAHVALSAAAATAPHGPNHPRGPCLAQTVVPLPRVTDRLCAVRGLPRDTSRLKTATSRAAWTTQKWANTRR